MGQDDRKVTGKVEDDIALGATLETAALFLSLALAVNLAIYGWLGALGAWSGKEANRGERLIYLLIAGAFKALAAGTWYALAFVDRPFG